MPTAAQIQQQIDQRLSGNWSKIVAAQDSYLAANGHYAQALPAASRRPVDGEEVAPDRLDASPTDQAESWRDLADRYGLTIPSTFMSLLRIDVYKGPGGKGYVVHAEHATADGRIFRKSVNVGPETWRDHPWHEVGGAT